MDFSWNIVIDAGLISVALVLATFLRSKISFFSEISCSQCTDCRFSASPCVQLSDADAGLWYEQTWRPRLSSLEHLFHKHVAQIFTS